MMRRSAALFRLGVVAAAVMLVWTGKRGYDNFNGVCREVGRKRTDDEKRAQLLTVVNSNLSPNFPIREAKVWSFSQLFHNLYWEEKHKSYPSDSYYELHTYSSFKDSDFQIRFYPDVPPYAKDGSGRYQKYNSGSIWIPVDLQSKLTGYAYDLVFIDMNLQATLSDGSRFARRSDLRTWADACGRPVNLLKEYQIG